MVASQKRANMLIADSSRTPWACRLADSLKPWPVDIHWSRSDVEAIELLSGTGVHLAVIDDNLPRAGGLDLLRRMRLLGRDFPTLLVCDEADQRLLQAALELNVYSVVSADPNLDLLTPTVFKVFNHFYKFDWNYGSN